jgi:hypothetical protein
MQVIPAIAINKTTRLKRSDRLRPWLPMLDLKIQRVPKSCLWRGVTWINSAHNAYGNRNPMFRHQAKHGLHWL